MKYSDTLRILLSEHEAKLPEKFTETISQKQLKIWFTCQNLCVLCLSSMNFLLNAIIYYG